MGFVFSAWLPNGTPDKLYDPDYFYVSWTASVLNQIYKRKHRRQIRFTLSKIELEGSDSIKARFLANIKSVHTVSIQGFVKSCDPKYRMQNCTLKKHHNMFLHWIISAYSLINKLCYFFTSFAYYKTDDFNCVDR